MSRARWDASWRSSSMTQAVIGMGGSAVQLLGMTGVLFTLHPVIGSGPGLTYRGKLSEMRVPIACTLVEDDVPQRVADWNDTLRAVTARETMDGGVRLQLASDAPVARIAELAVAEQQCCAFFEFALTVDARGVALEVTGPDEAAAVVEGLFGPVARQA